MIYLCLFSLNSGHYAALVLGSAELEIPNTLPGPGSLFNVSARDQAACFTRTYQLAVLDRNGNTGTNKRRLDVSLGVCQ